MMKFLSHEDLEIAREMEEYIAYVYCIPKEVLYEKDRKTLHVKPRFLLWFMLSKKGRWSFSAIGRRYNRDHATVLHAVRRVEELRWHEEIKDFRLSMLGSSYPHIHPPIIIL